jgi:hypothetical protein
MKGGAGVAGLPAGATAAAAKLSAPAGGTPPSPIQKESR